MSDTRYRRRGGGYILSTELSQEAFQILIDNGLRNEHSSEALEAYLVSQEMSNKEYRDGKAILEERMKTFDSMLEPAVRYHLSTIFLSKYGWVIT